MLALAGPPHSPPNPKHLMWTLEPSFDYIHSTHYPFRLCFKVLALVLPPTHNWIHSLLRDYFWSGSLVIEIISQKAIPRHPLTPSFHLPFQIYKGDGKSLKTPGMPVTWARSNIRSWELISTEKINGLSLCHVSCHCTQAKKASPKDNSVGTFLMKNLQ